MEFRYSRLHDEDDEFIEKFLDFQDLIYATYRKGEVCEAREFRKTNIKAPPSDTFYFQHIFALENGEIVGDAYVVYSNKEIETNPDVIKIRITVNPRHQGRGIAKTLLKKAAEIARKEGKRLVKTYTRLDILDGKSGKWLQKIGAKQVLTEMSNWLFRENVNWNYVSDVLGRGLAEEYSFVTIGRVEMFRRLTSDEAFAVEYADFMTEVGNLVPRGDSQEEDEVLTPDDMRKLAAEDVESNWENLTILCMDGDRIAGLTNCYHPENVAVERASTGFTGVRKAYQRRGIASTLKAMMTKYLFETFPNLKYIETENADSNDGMLKINRGLGYRRTQIWGDFEISLEELEEYISSMKA